MLDNVRRDLFHCGEERMVFRISDCKDAADLEDFIKAGGGIAIKSNDFSFDGDGGPFTITLISPGSNLTLCSAREAFSSEFILKCIIRNRILPLRDFWLKKSKRFPDKFDPNEILLRKISWFDAENLYSKEQVTENYEVTGSSPHIVIINGRVPCIKLERLKIQSHETIIRCDETDSEINVLDDDEEDYNVDSEEDTTNQDSSPSRCEDSLNNTKSKIIQRKSDDTQDERDRMVAYLTHKNRYKELLSDETWKRMSKNLPHHTWQSLKEHFTKKVMPTLEDYNLTPEIVSKFKDADMMSVSEVQEEEDRRIITSDSDQNTQSKNGAEYLHNIDGSCTPPKRRQLCALTRESEGAVVPQNGSDVGLHDSLDNSSSRERSVSSRFLSQEQTDERASQGLSHIQAVMSVCQSHWPNNFVAEVFDFAEETEEYPTNHGYSPSQSVGERAECCESPENSEQSENSLATVLQTKGKECNNTPVSHSLSEPHSSPKILCQLEEAGSSDSLHLAISSASSVTSSSDFCVQFDCEEPLYSNAEIQTVPVKIVPLKPILGKKDFSVQYDCGNPAASNVGCQTLPVQIQCFPTETSQLPFQSPGTKKSQEAVGSLSPKKKRSKSDDHKTMQYSATNVPVRYTRAASKQAESIYLLPRTRVKTRTSCPKI